MTAGPRTSLPAAIKAGMSPPADYFEAYYRANPDPWAYETSDYEREKYAASLAALPAARYRSGFEIGCSIGVFTAQLAARCDALLAVDYAPTAIARAQVRCAALSHVAFAQIAVPHDLPDARYDLIVMSEVGYYLSLDDLVRARAWMLAHLTRGGHLLLVHWTPFLPDGTLSGDAVHELFRECEGTGLQHRVGQRTDHYRLDLWERD